MSEELKDKIAPLRHVLQKIDPFDAKFIEEILDLLEAGEGSVKWDELPPQHRFFLKDKLGQPKEIITVEDIEHIIFGSLENPQTQIPKIQKEARTTDPNHLGRIGSPGFKMGRFWSEIDFESFVSIIKRIVPNIKPRTVLPIYVLYFRGRMSKDALKVECERVSEALGLNYAKTSIKNSVNEIANDHLLVNKHIIDGEEYLELSSALRNDIEFYLSKQKQEEEKKATNAESVVNRFVDFFKSYVDDNGKAVYIERLADLFTVKPSKTFVVEWMHLCAYDSELAELVKSSPFEALRRAEDAIGIILREEFFEKEHLGFRVVFRNVNEPIRVRDLGAEHFGKLVTFRGIVSGVVTKRKQFYERMVFVCKDVGHEMVRIQDPIAKVEVPSKCEVCGSKNITIDPKKSVTRNIIFFTVQDLVEDLNGNEQPARISVYMLDPEISVAPGDRVVITGIVRDTVLKVRTQLSELVVEGIHVEPLEDRGNVELKTEDIREIQDLATRYRDELPDAVARSLAPQIFADSELLPEVYYLKKAIVLAIASPKELDRNDERLWINVLVVGDKGTGKSRIIRDIKNITVAEYGDGGHFTAAGLIGTVERDDLSKEWIFRGGLMVRANGYVLALDEFEKAKPDDLAKMHTAMAQGEVNYSKATISTTLKTMESVIAAANPVASVFNPYKDVFDQIPIPASLLDRFDLIFILRQPTDEKVVDAILDHLDKVERGDVQREIREELLRKLFIYVNEIYPKLTDEALAEIKKFVKQVNKALINAGFKYSMRLRGIIKRLAIAHARLRLSDEVELKDVLAAEQVFTAAIKSWNSEDVDWKVLGEIEAQASKETLELIDRILKAFEELHKIYTRIPESEVIDWLKEAYGWDTEQAKYALSVAENRGLIRGDSGFWWLTSRA